MNSNFATRAANVIQNNNALFGAIKCSVRGIILSSNVSEISTLVVLKYYREQSEALNVIPGAGRCRAFSPISKKEQQRSSLSRSVFLKSD